MARRPARRPLQPLAQSRSDAAQCAPEPRAGPVSCSASTPAAAPTRDTAARDARGEWKHFHGSTSVPARAPRRACPRRRRSSRARVVAVLCRSRAPRADPDLEARHADDGDGRDLQVGFPGGDARGTVPADVARPRADRRQQPSRQARAAEPRPWLSPLPLAREVGESRPRPLPLLVAREDAPGQRQDPVPLEDRHAPPTRPARASAAAAHASAATTPGPTTATASATPPPPPPPPPPAPPPPPPPRRRSGPPRPRLPHPHLRLRPVAPAAPSRPTAT